VNLGLGEPDFLTPAPIRLEAIDFIKVGRIGYTTNSGLLSLRQKIAEYHCVGARQQFKAESVCVTGGAEEALFSVMLALAGNDDEVLCPDPGYIAYPVLARIAGAGVAYYGMPASRGFAFDRDRFRRALTTKTKLVVLVSPSNPTSRVLTGNDLQFIAGCLEGTDTYVVADEIYRELFYGERPASISEYYDKSIIVSGLSKMLSMTGWRLGWAAGPEEAMSYVSMLHGYASTCASAVSQNAALAAFTEDGRRATAEIREELGRRRDAMSKAIERELHLPYVLGEGAFYTMLDVSRYGASESVATSLLTERVITVPGSAFGVEGEGFLRLSFSVDEASIVEGVRRIATGLKKIDRR
jgi:aspartate/methionine/tyrosine aminotransferase